MFIRPKDYISVDNKYFFAVVSEYQEDDRALCWLRYIKEGNVMQKIETTQADQIIRDTRPELLYYSHYADIELHGIPLELIEHVYRPEQVVERLLCDISPDAKQEDAINIIKLLIDTGLKQDCIGVTGSLMLNAHNPESDIDLVIYGRELFFKARQQLKILLESGRLSPLNETFWRESYQRRNCTLSFAEYHTHELRKYNKFLCGDSKVDISMIPENYERFEECGPYKKTGRGNVVCIVTDDSYAYDFPSRYFIEHETLEQIVSYTATYTGQAKRGEKIEAAGYIEQGRDGRKRLLIGTSREAEGEYLRVLK
jgi:predicted nucleotidyltransferase